MNQLNPERITILLGNEAHNIATQFAREHINPQKGKRTYLNTLAVYAVNTYLQWFKIKTDLNASDSWNLAFNCLFDNADLVLTNTGKLECRPVLPEELTIYLPPEATIDRIGYVGVQFFENLNQVQLIGFIKATDLNSTEEISVEDFQPIDTLLDYLSSATTQETVTLVSANKTYLKQWFSNDFNDEWQIPSSLPINLATVSNVRNVEQVIENSWQTPTYSVTRAKLINLGIQIHKYPLGLIVKITSVEREKIGVIVKVVPSRGQHDLPEGVKLIVFDNTGNSSETISREEGDAYIQLKFSGELGEKFNVTISFKKASFTEHFYI